MPVNQKPLNRIGIFWYHFTPRKLLYHMVSVKLVKFGPHGLSVFLGPPCIYIYIYIYTGWPKKTPEQSIFQDFALINSYLFFTLLDRASFPHYNKTMIIKFGLKTFYFMSNFLIWTVHFRDFARFPEFRGTINDSFGRP